MDICNGDACSDPTMVMPFCASSPKKTYYATEDNWTAILKTCEK